MGVPQKIMRAHCAVIRPDHFKFASYGPAKCSSVSLVGQCCRVIVLFKFIYPYSCSVEVIST